MESSVHLVEERPNPTTDYYLLPALTAARYRVVRHGFDQLPRPADLQGAVVIFVRYLPAAWRRLVSRNRHHIERLVLFMDDDLLDPGASAGLPWRYRWKLRRLVTRHRRWLRRQRAELWVSTPALAHKYRAWHPRLLPPAPIDATEITCRVFYHGSAAHRAEIAWLRPVIAEALAANPGLGFEIIGDRHTARLYRDLPRTQVVHPLSWPNYQAFLSLPGRHIGLAPELPSPFNRGRSYTKFFDITRCGAVGLYAEDSFGAELLQGAGLILPMKPHLWTEAILELAADPKRRAQLYARALDKVAELRHLAQASYPTLWS